MRPLAENEQRERLKCVVHPSAGLARAFAGRYDALGLAEYEAIEAFRRWREP